MNIWQDVASLLKAARELIGKPENWAQGASGISVIREHTSWQNPKAVSFDATGAIFFSARHAGFSDDVRSKALKLLPRLEGTVSCWNDNTSHDRVMRAFTDAIYEAKAESWLSL